ncbi:restriction endonuclease subunit S [Victivallis sp. Marseille-Q1083]|uniref:restriction endonuclease subunit S n=1 Tax=Victivallis sp. Marseille-Q1083 TaxID=2717288 RepID=UPI00158A8267|nr:restriction endonuclease subunit S [Victivallis sp. Marseille-Q1083]
MKLPVGWRKIKLKDCGKWLGGATPSKDKASFWNGDIPWASSQDIKSRTLKSTTYSITVEGLNNSSSNLIPVNSLLMVTRSGILRHTFPVSKTLFPVAINQDIKALIPHIEFSTDYIQALLSVDNVNILKLCSKVGTTVESIEYDALRSYLLLFPPLPEQRRIAEFLGTWDEAIEKLERLIEAKEKRLSWIRANILTGKVRINGFSSKWKQIIFLEIASRVTRSVGKARVAPVSISAGKGFVLQEEKFGRNIAGKQYSKYTLLFPEEFTYNKGNSKTYECGCVYQWRGKAPVAVPNVFVSFSLNAKLADARFISHFFEADLHANELRKFINSGVRNDGLLNVTPDCFFKIILSLPELPEQKAIANILDTTSQEIDILRAELIMFQKQKRGLMQKLLTGTWRV